MRKELKQIAAKIMTLVMAASLVYGTVPANSVYADNNGLIEKSAYVLSSGNETSGNETSGNETSGNETSGNETSGNETSGNCDGSHTLGASQKQEATCTEDGWKDYYTCSVCGKHFSDAEGTTEIDNLATWKTGVGKLAKGHTLGASQKQEATCTEDGWKDYYTCSVCGKHFSDAEGTTEIDNLATWKTGVGKLAKGHTLGASQKKDATCKADGWKDYYTCSVCGKHFSDVEGTTEINNLATWKTSDGKILATGKHTYGAWTVDAEAAVGKEGKRSHKCSVCGNVESETIPALKEEASKPVDASKVKAVATGGITPTVTTKASGEAALNSVAKTSKTTVKVSEKVTVNGVDYTVTTVEANAFKNCTKVKTIQLPSSIKTVKKNAFKGCKKLKTVKLDVKKSITVKKGAFTGLDTTKMTIKVNKKMSTKELKKFQKALKKAGFKGKVKK